MSGTPSESEIQTQWKNAVDILEDTRAFIDGTLAGGGGLFDILLQSLEGNYTPLEIANAVSLYRSGCSSLIDQGVALSMLEPVIREYGAILAADASLGFGSGYTDTQSLFVALKEWFTANSLTVQSRNITFDTSATLGGDNVGNGAMSRLTVDENDNDIEFCHVEKKTFRCRSDQNTGADENAERFEFVGTGASQDALERSSHGSGQSASASVSSHHAGSGDGGSLLYNSTFSTYSAAGTPKFAGWTESAGGAYIAQDTSNYYRTHPGSQTDASLQITGGSGTVTLKQTLENMRIRSLDTSKPYFLRVMLNKTVGSAVGGTVSIKMGSATASVTIAGLGAGWQELMIEPSQSSWPKQFNEATLDVEIEWSSSTSGTLLVDDVLFAPYDYIDGTWWFLRGNAASHTAWMVDDTLTFTDTGGAPATAKIQWWLFVAGLGYLPSTTGTPTFTDP